MWGHRRTRSAPAIAALLAWLLAACGGGGSGSSTTPSSPSPGGSLSTSQMCNAIGSSGSASTAIVNGAECSTNGSAVVLLNLRDNSGPVGQCSGTVISARAVLTAAHCLINNTTAVQIFLGSGPQQVAQSFASFPGYREGDPNGLDVGVVIMPADIGRPAIPLLTSRDARVGETAIIAGWGKDSSQVAVTLRAGSAPITSVGANFLQTQFSSSVSSVCQGDSGGPLLLQEGGTWAIGGVISANQTTACAFGSDFYASMRNASISQFVLGLVPDAARR